MRRLRYAGLSIFRRIRALQSEFLRLSRERTPYTVHLHGVMACLLGLRALKGAIPRARVLCSPHAERLGSLWLAGLLGRLLQRHLPTFNYAPLATSLAEAQVLSRLLNRSVTVLQQPVSALFFTAPRHEDRAPSVLADGAGTEAVAKVTRLCVLLNGRGARVSFSWLGTAEGRTRAQLEAANIRLLRAADEADRARALSRAWLFIQMSRQDPSGVAQAMAAAVPCLVADIPAHRALIDHGETGFICTSERDLLESVLLLLRDGTERKRIGEAARAEAMRRFSEQGFQRALLRAYGFSMDHYVIRHRP